MPLNAGANEGCVTAGWHIRKDEDRMVDTRQEKEAEDRTGAQEPSTLFWVSHTRQLVSFHSCNGCRQIVKHSNREMWEKIYEYIESGYRIQ